MAIALSVLAFAAAFVGAAFVVAFAPVFGVPDEIFPEELKIV